VIDGLTAGNVTPTSTSGDSTLFVPMRVTRQLVLACVVLALYVPLVMFLQPRSRVPARMHTRVGIWSPVVASWTAMVAGPLLVKVMTC